MKLVNLTDRLDNSESWTVEQMLEKMQRQEKPDNAMMLIWDNKREVFTYYRAGPHTSDLEAVGAMEQIKHMMLRGE